LRELVVRLVDALEASTSAVIAERVSNAGQSEYSSREIAGFWYVHAMHTATPVLRHWLSSGDAHPEELYLRLAQLAGALCTFSLNAHPRDLPVYDHDAPERCFNELDRHIRRHLDVYRPANTLSLPIKSLGESLYAASVSDSRCFAPNAHWFLGVRAKAPAAEIIARTGKLVKICSSKFIARLVKEAYPGMTIEHVSVPPADLSPRIGTQYFAVQRTDPCWKSIVDSSEVGLYVPAALPDPELELKVIIESHPAR
jgi:type VI secretion system protein ImpJ